MVRLILRGEAKKVYFLFEQFDITILDNIIIHMDYKMKIDQISCSLLNTVKTGNANKT